MDTVRGGGRNAAIADTFAGVPDFPRTVRVARDGGLLSHLSIWQNLNLPLEYHSINATHVAEDAELLFELCGEDKTTLPRLMERYPDDLSAYEARLAGFVRAMLLEPEVLVLEDVYGGLSGREKERVEQWEKVFHLRFPFRELRHCGAGQVMQDKAGAGA